MTREHSHVSVMLAEVTTLLADTPQGVIVDATLGAGGHAVALLEASSSHRLIGLDRDPVALAEAGERLARFSGRARLVRSRFDRLASVVAESAPREPVSGVLFDLGVSSRQLDDSARGFSYRFDAPLDMRMDPDSELSAGSIVASWSEDRLASLFAESGESRFARRIARAIVRSRPIETTGRLSEVVASALPAPARRGGGHPAKRVFQALRIAVNEELEQLPAALEQAGSLLQAGGRLVVLSYHSGEDRIVKRFLAEAASGWCKCPPALPCLCGASPALRLMARGARKPSPAEVAANPRSASARLRAAERLAGSWREHSGGADQSTGERDGS
jgi:16S rRNA (cytosine1402-N4)-methyltransferase